MSKKTINVFEIHRAGEEIEILEVGCEYARRGDFVTVTCATSETEFKEYIATLVPNMTVLVITDLKE